MINNIELDDIRPMGFLLKKARHGRYLDAYKMKPINTDYFKKKLKSTLKTLHDRSKNGEIKFDNRHEDTEDDAVAVLDVSEYQTVMSTIDQIPPASRSEPFGQLKICNRC